MLLIIEFLIVSILILVLITLYVDEHNTRYRNVPVAKIKGYWEGKERREDPRFEKALHVRYMTGKKPRPVNNRLTKNIAKGGILLETSEKLFVESPLGLEINVPDHPKPISADAKVVWVKENTAAGRDGKRMFNAGIKFVYMEPRERERLFQYIMRLAA